MSAKINKISNDFVTMIDRIDKFIYDFGDKIF